jgi:hypothetical protein
VSKSDIFYIGLVLVFIVFIVFIFATPKKEETHENKIDVVITGLYHAEYHTGKPVHYVNFLVDAKPETMDFDTSEQALAFARLLEEKYQAVWMEVEE